MGPLLDALDEATLARMPLSTAEAVRQEHRIPFARSLKHALRIFFQTHNTLQVASASGPHNEALVTKLERDTKPLHITPGFYSRRMDALAGRNGKERTGSGAGSELGAGTEMVTRSGYGTGTGMGQEEERERSGGERRSAR